MSTTTQLSELKNNDVMPHDIKIDFFSKQGFDLAIRIAKAMSTSDAVPESFRQFVEKREQGGVKVVENNSAIGNCLVAIEVAKTVGMSMVSVMQNADVIQGKLRWSSKFQIAAINASGRFSPLKFKLNNLGKVKAKYREKTTWNKESKRFNFEEREVEIDNWECIAWAQELDQRKNPTGEIVQSIPVTMQMAVEEGWYSKDGSKWQGSMRFQMLQYRAASFFASIYAPDVIMGMGRSSEEESDIVDLVPQPDGTYQADSRTIDELRSGRDQGKPTSESRKQETDKKPTPEPEQKPKAEPKPEQKAAPSETQRKPREQKPLDME
ncbi:hypothetical protein [Nitrosomonas marina]|uniref:Recombination protein RecT n=1 Tax=Nitrosomonas marina TaxID=917 RepID=A0A1H8ITU1_9PROT|nr:hypothetical protein [Nitrosomonas marina]SEN71851.1 hypothetical protein SAMN05216325_14016 [Nitrosomonas marina]